MNTSLFDINLTPKQFIFAIAVYSFIAIVIIYIIYYDKKYLK